MNSQPILVTFPYGHYLDSCVGVGGDYTYLCSDACAAEFFKDLANKPEQYQAKLIVDK